MIAKGAANSQKSAEGRALKKIVSLLPEDAPSKIYNTVLRIPGLRELMGTVVRSGIQERVEVNGYTLFLDKQDIGVSGQLSTRGFEPYETEMFRSAVKSGMNILDIGAHIGYYTLLASKSAGPSGKVFAFEPEPANFSLLKKNVAANRADNVTLVNSAASDKNGTHELFIEKYNRGHHSFGPGSKNSEKIIIRTLIIDDYLGSLGDPKIDIIKIDIEGAEPIAFRGLKGAVARNPDIVIFTEVYPRCMDRLGESASRYLHDLSSYGLRLWNIDEHSKSLKLIADIDAFVAAIPPGESFRNVLAAK